MLVQVSLPVIYLRLPYDAYNYLVVYMWVKDDMGFNNLIYGTFALLRELMLERCNLNKILSHVDVKMAFQTIFGFQSANQERETFP